MAMTLLVVYAFCFCFGMGALCLHSNTDLPSFLCYHSYDCDSQVFCLFWFLFTLPHCVRLGQPVKVYSSMPLFPLLAFV